MPRPIDQLPPDATSLARRIQSLERAVNELRATRRLAHSSLTGTAITVYDTDGVTPRGAIGLQPDGTLGLVAEGGPAPSAPTQPLVTPSIGGLRVVWDGTLADGSTLPADFDHVAVYVSTVSGDIPSPATFAGTITRSGDGGMLPVTPLPYQQHYVVLVAVNTSGNSSSPSTETAAAPLQVTSPDLTAGSVTSDKQTAVGGANLLSDPSFEGAYTASCVAGLSYASQDNTKGNGSPTSIKINAVSVTPAYRSVQLTLLPTLPGEQLYLAADYYVSSDWVGTEVDFQVRWETDTGTILSYGKATTSSPVREAWTRLSGTFTAPAQATKARIRVESGNATAGTVWWDNAVVRPVVGSAQIQDGAVTTPKIVAGAVTADRLEAVLQLVTRLVAGDPAGARVELNADGLRVYNSSGALTIRFDSVDGSAVFTGAITGSTMTGGTITGSTVQTASTGRRIVIGTDNQVKLYSGHASETFPGFIQSNVQTDAGVVTSYIDIDAPQIDAVTPQSISLSTSSDGSRSASIDGLTVETRADGSKHVSVAGELTVTASGSNTQGLTLVDGVFAASNMAWGTVSITPSAANTPTSVTVTGLNVRGNTFTGFATARTAAPGTKVTGVGVSAESSTSLVVWLTRTDTTASSVAWLLMGSKV